MAEVEMEIASLRRTAEVAREMARGPAKKRQLLAAEHSERKAQALEIILGLVRS